MTIIEENARRAQLTAIAETYFKALANKDVSSVPWDDDIVLHSPLAPGGLDVPLQGKRAVTEWFASLYSVLGR